MRTGKVFGGARALDALLALTQGRMRVRPWLRWLPVRGSRGRLKRCSGNFLDRFRFLFVVVLFSFQGSPSADCDFGGIPKCFLGQSVGPFLVKTLQNESEMKTQNAVLVDPRGALLANRIHRYAPS